MKSQKLLVIPFLLISILAVSLILVSDYLNFEKKFNTAAEDFHSQFQLYMRQNEAVLEGLSAFVAGVGGVNEEMLNHYAKKVKAKAPHIYMLEIAEEVKKSNLDSYLQRKRNKQRDFEIRSFDYNGNRDWKNETNKDRYFPLIYLYPMPDKENSVLGLNLLSNENLSMTLEKALSHGACEASLPFMLAEGGKAFVMMKKIELNNVASPLVALIVVTAENFVFQLDEKNKSFSTLVYHNSKNKKDTNSHFVSNQFIENRWLPVFNSEIVLGFNQTGFVLDVSKQIDFKDVRWVLLFVVLIILVLIYFVMCRILYKNKLTQDKLHKASQQKHKMLAISNLTGGIAHEFNNNLSVTRGFLNLLAEKNIDNESKNWIQHIENATEKSIELTNKLLTYSQYSGVRERVSSTIISDEINKLKPDLFGVLDKNVEIKYKLDNDRYTSFLSEIDLKEILVELVTNSNDAIDGNGIITISSKYIYLEVTHKFEEDNSIDIVEGNYICFSVTDTGCGVTEYIKAHIFDPFFTTKEFGQSSGMGLSIVYGLVKLNNGYIVCSPNTPKGTIFSVYMPVMNKLK